MRRDKPKSKSKRVFPETTVEDVAGCLKYDGEPKTLEEMEEAIEKGVVERFGDRCPQKPTIHPSSVDSNPFTVL